MIDNEWRINELNSKSEEINKRLNVYENLLKKRSSSVEDLKKMYEIFIQYCSEEIAPLMHELPSDERRYLEEKIGNIDVIRIQMLEKAISILNGNVDSIHQSRINGESVTDSMAAQIDLIDTWLSPEISRWLDYEVKQSEQSKSPRSIRETEDELFSRPESYIESRLRDLKIDAETVRAKAEISEDVAFVSKNFYDDIMKLDTLIQRRRKFIFNPRLLEEYNQYIENGYAYMYSRYGDVCERIAEYKSEQSERDAERSSSKMRTEEIKSAISGINGIENVAISKYYGVMREAKRIQKIREGERRYKQKGIINKLIGITCRMRRWGSGIAAIGEDIGDTCRQGIYSMQRKRNEREKRRVAMKLDRLEKLQNSQQKKRDERKKRKLEREKKKADAKSKKIEEKVNKLRKERDENSKLIGRYFEYGLRDAGMREEERRRKLQARGRRIVMPDASEVASLTSRILGEESKDEKRHALTEEQEIAALTKRFTETRGRNVLAFLRGKKTPNGNRRVNNLGAKRIARRIEREGKIRITFPSNPDVLKGELTGIRKTEESEEPRRTGGAGGTSNKNGVNFMCR